MIVAKNNQGDFDSVQAAIDSIPSSNTTWCTIYIKNGVYKEKIHITSPYIRLLAKVLIKQLLLMMIMPISFFLLAKAMVPSTPIPCL